MKNYLNINLRKVSSFLFCYLIFFSLNSQAQTDGLDENAFEAPTDMEQPSNPDTDAPNVSLDEAPIEPDLDPENRSANTNIPTDTTTTNASPSAIDSETPAAFDASAMPKDTNPESLSNQIKNMNPETLTREQDYFPSFIYDERGRKDPFAPKLKEKFVQSEIQPEAELSGEDKVRAGLAKFEVSALTLTAILIGKANRPKALIKDPTGTVYVVHENDIVGRNNGVVKNIRQGQVVILEYRDQKEGDRLYTTQVLSLGK